MKNQITTEPTKYSTIDTTRNGMTYISCYPDVNGIETLDSLYEIDPSNTIIFECTDFNEAKEDVKAQRLFHQY